MDISETVRKQRAFFETGATLDTAYRRDALRRLRGAILEMEAEINAALQSDLGKSASEAYMTEVGMVLSEIGFVEKRLAKWSRRKRVRTPFAQFHAASYELACPYGTVLVMSPWNYPFMLALEPAIDALAAGNTVVMKPSAYSPATSRVLETLCARCLPPELITVVTGGREVNAGLLDEAFDYIFFTGGKTVGRLVMEKAARHLTPVTLELGGKSPCIVDKTADIKRAARRIVFGKFLNVGQTCVAPDYLLVEASVKDALLDAIQAEITRQFGSSPIENPDYGNIVNQKHFERLTAMLEGDALLFGGQTNPETLKIAPTVIPDATPGSRCMQEEIFGPILPVLTYRTRQELYETIKQNPTPLALYLFTSDRSAKREVMRRVSFGGGCVNDTIIHLATGRLGFGGVGESGMGQYHGRYGFETFTHRKSIVDKKTWLDLPMRYQPYSKGKDSMIRSFLK